MTVQTQLRRSLFSLVILVVFGGLAAVKGEASAKIDASEAMIANCPSAEQDGEPVATVGSGSPARVDWRALLPAMIAR